MEEKYHSEEIIIEEEKKKKLRLIIFWWFFGVLFLGGAYGVFAMSQTSEVNDTPTLNITLNEVLLEEGENLQLSYESSFPDNLITWTSLNREVVEVVNGKLTAKGSGTTQVTVSGNNGAIIDTIFVTVEEGPAPVITFTIDIGDTSFIFEEPVRVGDLEIPVAPDKIMVLYLDEERQTPLSLNDVIDEDTVIYVEYQNPSFTLTLLDEAQTVIETWTLENNVPLSDVLETELENLVGYFVNPITCGEGMDLTQTLSEDLTVTQVFSDATSPCLLLEGARIKGTALLNQTLTAQVFPVGADVSFQWYRVNTLGERTSIDGATAKEYVVNTLDQGLRLEVDIEGTGDYHDLITLTSTLVPTATVSSGGGGGTSPETDPDPEIDPVPETDPEPASTYDIDTFCTDITNGTHVLSDFYTGIGTESNPYIISDWWGLEALRYIEFLTFIEGQSPITRGLHFALGANLNKDTKGFDEVVGETGIIPISILSKTSAPVDCSSRINEKFRHNLDGKGYEISDFHISYDFLFGTEINQSGLFANFAAPDYIRNIIIRNASNISEENIFYAGLLAGYIEISLNVNRSDSFQITNITLSGVTVSTINARAVGALAGTFNYSDLYATADRTSQIDINHIHVDGFIEGLDIVGGVIGYIQGSVSTNLNEYKINFSEIAVQGAIKGQPILDSRPAAIVWGDGIGGIVGVTINRQTSIERAIVAADISGYLNVAGFVGLDQNTLSEPNTNKTYNDIMYIGTVTNVTGASAGIANAMYNDSSVTHPDFENVIVVAEFSSENAEAIFGNAGAGTSLSFTNVYYDSNLAVVSGTSITQSIGTGVTGKTTLELLKLNTLTQGSFSTTKWAIGFDGATDDETYPWLLIQGSPYPVQITSRQSILLSSGYIPIASYEDLQSISQSGPNIIFGSGSPYEGGYEHIGLSDNYVLVNDIDLNNLEWNNISSQSSPFKGVFDGNGYTISNLDFGIYQGLFSHMDGGTIKNLTLENTSSSDNTSSTGALVGSIIGDGTNVIENVIINNVSIYGTDYVGGLIGQIVSDSTTDILTVNISNVTVSGLVSGTNKVSGLIGYAREHISINLENINTYGTLEVGTNGDAGGLIGTLVNESNTNRRYESSLSITESNNYMNITGYAVQGGLVGVISGTDNQVSFNAQFSKVANYGDLSMNNVYGSGANPNLMIAGGLIGVINLPAGGIVSINQAYNIGDIHVNYSNLIYHNLKVGGLIGEVVGSQVNIDNTYTMGRIILDGTHETTLVGGLIGSSNSVNIGIDHSYSMTYFIDNGTITSGTKAIGGIIGYIQNSATGYDLTDNVFYSNLNIQGDNLAAIGDENSVSGTNNAANFGSSVNMDDISNYSNYDISLGNSASETIWKIGTLDGFATYAWLSFQGEPAYHNFLD